MHIIIPSDVFPPRCGGAGWSSHALATALIARGHTVAAVVPGPGAPHADVLGVPTARVPYRAPGIPFVKNMFRHELLWPRMARAIVAEAGGAQGPLVIHAQHVQVAPAAVLAGRSLGARVVVTVRDHWPWDYFATGLHGNTIPYQGQTWASLATDLAAREGPLRGALALPAIPYMLGHLRRRQAYLRRADAVIAVSGYIAQRLRGIVPDEKIHVIPNMVDTDAIAQVTAELPRSITGEYLLFVGKLDMNKGAQLLAPIFAALRERGYTGAALPPLVVAGNGPLRPQLERDLAALGVDVRFLDWAEHDEVLRLMAHCTALLFPSAWGEPLSRVWLEAAACGAPIVAMPTGGIHDVIADGAQGLLAATPERFAAHLAALLADAPLRARLGASAQSAARERFSAPRVVAQVEQVYAGETV